MCPAYINPQQIPYQQVAYATGVTATEGSTVQQTQHVQHVQPAHAQHSVHHPHQFQHAPLMHHHHHHHNRRSPSPPAEEGLSVKNRGVCARHAFDGAPQEASSVQQRRTKSEDSDIESAQSAEERTAPLPALAPPGLPKTRCSMCSLAFIATCGCILFVIIVLVELPLLALFGYKMALENHAI